MRRRFVTAGALAAALSVAALGVTTLPSQAATTWVTTATQGTHLASATALGALPATQQITIDVALKVQNMSGLRSYVQAINTPGNAQYGQSLTPAQFKATYAPTDAQVQAVESYLQSEGLTNISAESNNLFVTATGSAAQIESAFDTQIGLFSQNGAQVFANTTAAQVPDSLGGVVLSVLGLNDASVMTTPHHTPTATGKLSKPAPAPQPPAACATINVPATGPILYEPLPTSEQYLTAFTPQGFQTTYDARSVSTGCNTAIAIMAEGNVSGVVTDLRTEESTYGLPQVPVTVVATGIASTDTSGADEWDLDTQTSSGMAETVKMLYIYDATSLTDSDTAIEFNKFVSQDVAKAGSASFGECEVFPYVDGAMVADDEVFAEAAAQGQTMFASAGDTGGFCAAAPTNGVPAGGPFVNYPASSPYVVAVGGTSLLPNSDGSYNQEIAWLAGGGGTSVFETGGYWQSGIVPTINGTVGKAVPDVAMDADPNSGAAIYVNGAQTIVGGTSLSSPLTLGVWARIESSHTNSLGFAAPLFYQLYSGYTFPQTGQVPTSASGFHDIILGNTGPYEATPGYDYATGLGTFDVAVINGLIK